MERREGRWGRCCCWEPAEGLQGEQNGINRLDGVCCPSGGAAELWGRMLCFLGFMINQKLLIKKKSQNFYLKLYLHHLSVAIILMKVLVAQSCLTLQPHGL